MKRKAISLIGVSLLIISTFMLYACLPSDSSESDPYSVRVYDTTSEANPAYVMVQGLITDNATIYALLEDGSLTTLDGIIVGDGSFIGAITRPGGDVVGTTETQTLTDKTLTAPVIDGTVTGTDLALPSWTATGHISGDGWDLGDPNTGTLSPFRYAYFGTITRYVKLGQLSNICWLGWSGGYLRIGNTTNTTNHGLDSVGEVLITKALEVDGPVYVDNNIRLTGYEEFTETTAPGAGAADTARMYAVNNVADNLTDMSIVYQDGTVDIFSQESTPLNSPIFTYASDTEVSLKMIKPHPGLIQFAMVYPDGSKFVIREIEYHDAEKIAANTGCESPVLPPGWKVTTLAERVASNTAELGERLKNPEITPQETQEIQSQKEKELARLRVSE